MSDLAKWNVRGPIQSMRSEFAEWDLSTEEWQPPRHSTFTVFRPDGRISSTEHHNPDGSVPSSRYAYGGDGRLLEIQHQLDGAPSGKTVYQYDDSGRLVRVAGVDHEGHESVIETWSYGAGGRRTKTYFVPKLPPGTGFMYSVDGSEQSYTANNAVAIVTNYGGAAPDEAVFYDAEQRVVHRVTLQCDRDGRLLREEARFGDVGLGGDTEAAVLSAATEAPEAAAMIAQLFAPDNFFASTTYSYDAAGDLVERIQQFGGLSEERTTFRYDNRGNRIEETHEDVSHDITLDDHGKPSPTNERSHRHHVRLDLSYDERGNWTERVVWTRLEPNPNFQRSNIERRQIVYW